MGAARRAATLTPADVEVYTNFNNVVLTRASVGELSDSLDPLLDFVGRIDG
jgi:hypothetical protein